MRVYLLIFILVQSGCESNRFENWNEMKNKIVTQESEIDTLKKIVSQRSDDFSQLKSEMSHIQNQLNRKSNKSNLEIESQIYSIPFIPLIDKIDLSRLIGKKVGLYEVELINIEDLEFTGIDPNIDFQLTLSTRLLLSLIHI